MRLPIEVPDEQALAIQDEMARRGFAVQIEQEEDWVVPQWQIDETRRRQALPNEPEPRAWSEIEQEYVSRGL